jgi:hypothetical protein
MSVPLAAYWKIPVSEATTKRPSASTSGAKIPVAECDRRFNVSRGAIADRHSGSGRDRLSAWPHLDRAYNAAAGEAGVDADDDAARAPRGVELSVEQRAGFELFQDQRATAGTKFIQHDELHPLQITRRIAPPLMTTAVHEPFRPPIVSSATAPFAPPSFVRVAKRFPQAFVTPDDAGVVYRDCAEPHEPPSARPVALGGSLTIE